MYDFFGTPGFKRSINILQLIKTLFITHTENVVIATLYTREFFFKR